MSKTLMRTVIQGVLRFALVAIAAWLAVYITNQLLGEPGENEM